MKNLSFRSIKIKKIKSLFFELDIFAFHISFKNKSNGIELNRQLNQFIDRVVVKGFHLSAFHGGYKELPWIF